MQDDVAYDKAMKEERGNENPSELLLLYQRVNKLNETLEDVLVQHVATSELRNFYRLQAGTEQKDELDKVGKQKRDAQFQFEFIDWMEKYSDKHGHYPPPMQCYLFLMKKLKLM